MTTETITYDATMRPEHNYAPGTYTISVKRNATGEIATSTLIVEIEARPGTPGQWLPTGSQPPADFNDLNANLDLYSPPPQPGLFGASGNPARWSNGDYVVLGDGSHAFWGGEQWEQGEAGETPFTEIMTEEQIHPTNQNVAVGRFRIAVDFNAEQTYNGEKFEVDWGD